MRSKDYWKNVQAQVARQQFKKVDDYTVRLIQLEYGSIKQHTKDVEVFYSRFAENNEITLQ